MTNNIKKLSDYSHIRLRVPMYLGSDESHTQSIVLYRDMQPVVSEVAWTPALFTCLREIIDNALDEIIGHGHGNRIDIGFDPKTLVFSVQDNGRGIPIDFDKNEKQYLATMVLTEPKAGRNFDERGEVAGANGVGSSAVSNTSEWFKVEIVRDGKKFKQMFREGMPGATSLDILKPKITEIKSDKTGTLIEFLPSKEVFKSRIVPEEFIKARIIDIAVCNPTLKIFYNGEQIKVKPRQELTLFPNIKPITIDINEGKLRSKFWITYGNDGAEHVHSMVNNIPVFNGGVHIDAFRRLFYGNLLTGLERESKKRKLTPNRSDVQDGLFIYNITTMDAPNFDSQSKTRLINEDVASAFKKQLEDAALYRDLIKKNPEWITAIYDRCAARTMKKDASDLSKLNKAAKRTKIEELQDAIGTDRSKCKLFICEGKSAVSGINEARDSEIHGAIPLRGKVLNVYGKHLSKPAYNQNLKKIADNDALKKIAGAIGLVVGEKAIRRSLRYGEVYIATDADADGCLVGETLVHTLKYGPVRIDELSEKFGDDPFYVWSRDKDGIQRPGLAHSPRITKYVNKTIKVTLDNGKVIEATENHPFMMVDGSFLRADQLSIGNSLKPFNYRRGDHRRAHFKNEKLVWDEEYGQYYPEYWIVHRRMNPRWDFRNSFYDDNGVLHQIDHIDEDHWNNSPDNLQLLTLSEHKTKTLVAYNKSDAHKKRVSELWTQGKYDTPERLDAINLYNKSDKNRKATAELNKSKTGKIRQRLGKSASVLGKLIHLGLPFNSENYRRFYTVGAPRFEAIDIKEVSQYLNNKIFFDRHVASLSGLTEEDLVYKTTERKINPQITQFVNNCRKIMENNKPLSSSSYEVIRGVRQMPWEKCLTVLELEENEVTDWVDHYNHLVSSIEIVDHSEPIPVWDITVDEFHNFALDSGCYVHNSNIAALLVNYFYQLWPELFDSNQKPFISIFQTPFIIATKGKMRKYWYNDNYKSFDPAVYKGWSILRAKGLGALEKEDWDIILKDPRLTPINDEGDLGECLDLLFSPDADKRKDWLGE